MNAHIQPPEHIREFIENNHIFVVSIKLATTEDVFVLNMRNFNFIDLFFHLKITNDFRCMCCQWNFGCISGAQKWIINFTFVICSRLLSEFHFRHVLSFIVVCNARL